MNCLHRTIFSKAKNALVATSVLTSGQSKSVQGGQVTSSSAAIIKSAGNTTVQQTSPNAPVSWSNFSVDKTKHVAFQLTNASALALNPVLDTCASQIVSAFSAIRPVCLVNSNDIRFGTDANEEITKASCCSSN